MRTQLDSIRWRLPLSYIGVALLAALASGVLMLVTLRGYYREREHSYLQKNARQIGWVAQQLLQAGSPDAERVLADQIVHWSFLLQVRVQVLDAGGQTLADSGVPDAQQVVMVSGGPGPVFGNAPTEPTDTFAVPLPPARGGMFILSAEGPALGGDIVVSLDCRADAEGVLPAECQNRPTIIQYAAGGPAADEIGFAQAITEPVGPIGVAMPMAGSLYGFELEAPAEVAARSTERVGQPILNADGQWLGAVVLSEGPAYGREILLSAMAAWAAASLLAMVLAGAAGVWVSRRITAPLLALTHVTERMAAGNLAARAEVNVANEFGQLGGSFNAMAERVTNTIHTLRQFVADAAHELNTPLTALQTNLELAASADESERGELLTRAQAQIERLRGLVTGLLDLSRLEARNDAPHRVAVDLAALAQALGEPYASRAEQAGLTLEMDLPNAPLLTPGDPAQLRRVLENLLDNAIKFTPAGGEVRLRVMRVDGQIVFSVEDTGIGIPPEDRPLLFRRFHRGRNAASYSGNGLGLAIVHAIVEAHGGGVAMATMAGGTCFRVYLPSHPDP